MSAAQLRELGATPSAIRHRVASGRLHVVHRGVYAVDRRQLSQRGVWMAALLACGPNAVLSHLDGALLLGVLVRRSHRGVHVTVPPGSPRRRPGLTIHRRSLGAGEIEVRDGIRVTKPPVTLVDIATILDRRALETAINRADTVGVITIPGLRRGLQTMTRRPGLPALRALLDPNRFHRTRSELERMFLELVADAGLPAPQTNVVVNGFEVDFFWPELGLVVETDGLRYHRTPAQQAADRRRDQSQVAAGLTVLRFTHAQVTRRPEEVERVLVSVVRRLGGAPE